MKVIKPCVAIVVAALNLTSSISCAQKFEWARRTGGTADEFAESVVSDTNGNVYVVGFFKGVLDFDPGIGTFPLTSSGESDVFISKLDSAGNFLWARQIGGVDEDVGQSVTTDASGNVYLTGSFTGMVDFDPGMANFNMTATGYNPLSPFAHSDIFILKLDSGGNFVWARQLGGLSNDAASSISLDTYGNIYTTGYFYQSADFDPDTGVFNLSSADRDIFISKLDSVGGFVWANQLRGARDLSPSITIDFFGDIYLTGLFVDTIYYEIGANTHNHISMGGPDIFVCKLNSVGSFLWVNHIGGIGYDEAYSVVTDDSGNVYTTGYFSGTVDFDPGAGTFSLTSIGREDIFISKLDSAGNFRWVRRMGGTGTESGQSIAIDATGSIFLTGYFRGTTDFDPSGNIYNLSSGPNLDIFISKLDNSGNFVWAKHFGGIGVDIGKSIAIDASGNVLTCGDFVATANLSPCSNRTTYNSIGNYDFFVHKIGNCSAPIVTGISTFSCDSFISPSTKYVWQVDGIYSDTVANTACCDSVISISLTVLGSTSSNISQTACRSYLSPSTKHTWTTSGIFKDTVLNSIGCDSVVTINLTVKKVDTSVTNSNPTLSANAIGATYQWLTCDSSFVILNDDTNQNYTPANNGSYSVQVTQNGCIDTSACIAVNNVGFLENGFGSGVRAFPNPTKEKLSINLGNSYNEITVIVRNELGQKLFEASYIQSSLLELKIPEAPGVYLVEVSTVSKKLMLKVLKQ